MPEAARITDRCKHKVTLVITGSTDTITGGKFQARLGDITTGPCPICKLPPLPGRIMQGSMSVFVNSLPASRVNDLVLCGAGVPPVGPPPKVTPILVTSYEVADTDNYVAAMFSDDGILIKEPPPKDPPKDVPEDETLTKFLDGLTLNLNLGMRLALAIMGAGLNAVDSGCSTVIIGG